MQSLIRQLLAELGEDPGREGLLNTPKRVEKALRFLTSGYSMDVDEVLNNALLLTSITPLASGVSKHVLSERITGIG